MCMIRVRDPKRNIEAFNNCENRFASLTLNPFNLVHEAHDCWHSSNLQLGLLQ